jgi:hypothetical protein
LGRRGLLAAGGIAALARPALAQPTLPPIIHEDFAGSTIDFRAGRDLVKDLG